MDLQPNAPTTIMLKFSGVRTGGVLGVNPPPPFGDGTGSEDLSFYFNNPLLLRTELAEIANMSLLFNSPV